MPISSEINALIARLNQELNQIEQETIEGLDFARIRLKRFPNNAVLIQFFAYFNNIMLFVETSRRRIAYSQVILLADTTTDEQTQEVGEDLSTLLGLTLETQIGVERVKNRLENWK